MSSSNIFKQLDNIENNVKPSLQEKNKNLVKGERKKKIDCVIKKILSNFFKTTRIKLAKILNCKTKNFYLRQDFFNNPTINHIQESMKMSIYDIYMKYSKFSENFKALIQEGNNYDIVKSFLNVTLKDALKDYFSYKDFEKLKEKVKNKSSPEYYQMFEETSIGIIEDFEKKKSYKTSKKVK